MDATRLAAVAGRIGLAEPPFEPLSGVRGLLFELPGVLYEATVWRRWLLRVLARQGLQTHYDAFYEAWDNDYLDEVNAGRRPLKDALAAFLLSAGCSAALVDEVLAAAGAQRKLLDSDPRLLPGVAATLELLNVRGLALAVSADSDESASQLREKLKKLGVAGRFRAVVSSRDLQAAKPEPICYLSAIGALGLAPAEVAFVGSRPAHLGGAKALGMPVVALSAAPCEAADRHIGRFDRLSQIVETPRVERRAA